MFYVELANKQSTYILTICANKCIFVYALAILTEIAAHKYGRKYQANMTSVSFQGIEENDVNLLKEKTNSIIIDD